MQWLKEIISPSNLWTAFKFLFPAAAAAVSGWISSLAQLPRSVTILMALMTAACVLIVIDQFRSWFDRRNEHLRRIAELEQELKKYQDAGAEIARKEQLLNNISELRGEMTGLRIEMESDRSVRRHSDAEWLSRLENLQIRIASVIEQFSSRAEAETYRHKGNLRRPLNTNMGGGFLNPLHLDICIDDLDYLQKFIQDYSRKNRS